MESDNEYFDAFSDTSCIDLNNTENNDDYNNKDDEVEYSDACSSQKNDVLFKEDNPIESLKLSDHEGNNENANMKRIEYESHLSDQELLNLREKSLILKEDGNGLFSNGLYNEAIKEYSDAIQTCPLKFSSDHSIFYANRAACLAKLEKNDEAIKDCCDALDLNPRYLKVLLRRAELRERTEKLTEALEDYREILKINPNHVEALHKEKILPEMIKCQQEKMKEEMMTQLKQLGNLVLKPFGLSTDNFQMVQDSNTGGYSINFKK